MAHKKEKKEKRVIRHRRVRAKVFGTALRPRLSVFKSNTHIYGQIIDDALQCTVVSFSDLAMKDKKEKNTERARAVGKMLATEAKKKNITNVVFDRGGFRYHGRIKALAEGAREGGLVF